jgi:hypothetical protein
MKNKEEEFKRELEVFRTEVDASIQFFYTELSIHAVLGDDKQALNIVNRTPLFWRTNVGSLQTSFFIVLGRIFDQKSNHNIDKLLRIAQNNSIIFSAEALERRTREKNANASEWIDDFMKDVYVPSVDDFRRLRKHVNRYRKIYIDKYKDIRRKVFAHKEISKKEDVQKLFAKTNIREMQKLIIFLNRLHLALWEVFHNGHKPTLKPMKYSVKSLRMTKRPEWHIKHVQEHIVEDTEKFFEILRGT